MKGCANVQSLERSSLNTRDVGRTDGGKSKESLCREVSVVVVLASLLVRVLLVVAVVPREDEG